MPHMLLPPYFCWDVTSLLVYTKDKRAVGIITEAKQQAVLMVSATHPARSQQLRRKTTDFASAPTSRVRRPEQCKAKNFTIEPVWLANASIVLGRPKARRMIDDIARVQILNVAALLAT
jgi:hypothetical protein